MINKGVKGKLAEGPGEGNSWRRLPTAARAIPLSLLYGGGAALINSGGAPWTAAYVDTFGELTADLRSNIAAESRAKIIYERLINVTDDSSVKDALGFLRTREIAHQTSFEKALYAIAPHFPSGKLPGMPEFTHKYYNLSQGNGDAQGPWNSGENWEAVSALEDQSAVEGGDGTATVKLIKAEEAAMTAAAVRTASDPNSDPMTGAELGAGPGSGIVDEDDVMKSTAPTKALRK
jgi:Mn-containing catalase